MFQIVYISFASESFDAESDYGVDDILAKAHDYNTKHNITGMLLYKGGVFLQLLEGEHKDIEHVFGRIALDLRHEGIKILVKQEAQERLFSHWTMAYKKMDELDLGLVSSIIPWEKIIDDANRRRTIPKTKILEIFKKFRYEIK